MNEKECRKVLSANIKLHRSRLHLSQLDLALLLEISPNFLSDVETGKKWVSPHTLSRLADALNVEVYELFKPEADLPIEISAILDRCLTDISAAIKKTVSQSVMQIFTQTATQMAAQFINQAVSESINQSVKETLDSIRDYYDGQ
jgi:transcriptional regulator with XRE-family HTH domain